VSFCSSGWKIEGILFNNDSLFFAKVNFGYKPPELKGTSGPIMISDEVMILVGTLAPVGELMISGGNTCASVGE
jgi:hypothetical protein